MTTAQIIWKIVQVWIVLNLGVIAISLLINMIAISLLINRGDRP